MIRPHNKGTLLYIRVIPRSKKKAIVIEEAICHVHVKAPPIRGQANLEAEKIVAKRLKIPKNRVNIISGKKSTNKILLIEGLDPRIVHAALSE